MKIYTPTLYISKIMSTDTILGGVLAVTGATTLRSTLVVSGATSLNNSLFISNAITIGSATGSATPANQIFKNTIFNKAVTLSSTLLSSAAVTFNGTVRFSNAPTFVNFPTVPIAKISGLSASAPDSTGTSRLFVNNPMYLKSILDVSGNSVIRGRLDVSGDSVIRGRLDVSGDSVILGRLDVSGGLDISGASRFANDVSFIGQRVDICGNLYAQYPANSIPQIAIIGGVGSDQFTTDVFMSKTLKVDQAVTFGDKLTVKGDASFNSQRVDICGNLYAQYPANSIPQIAIIGGVGSDTFTTDVTMTKSLNVNESATIGNNLTVLGDVSFNNSMKVNGPVNLKELNVASKATFKTDVDICGNLAAIFVPGSIPPAAINGGVLPGNTLTNDVTMTKSLNVNESATIGNNLTVLGDVSFNNAMKVNGPVNLKELNVASKATFKTDVDICGNLAAIFVPGSISPAAINGGVLSADTLTNDVTFSKSLTVSDGLTSTTNTLLRGPVTLEQGMTVTNKATFNSAVDICGNLAAIFAPGSISSTAIGDGALSTRVFINDISMNKRLYVAGNATFDENAYINKDLTVLGRLMVQQYTDSSIIRTTTNEYVVIVTEDLSVNGNIVIEDSAKINKLTVLNDISSGGLLYVNGLGKSVFLDNVDICGNLTANFADDSIPVRAIPGLASAITKSTTAPDITEDVSLNKRLFVNGDISSGGLLYVNASVGDSRIKSNLTVDGFIVGQYQPGSISTNAVTGLDNAINNIPNLGADMTLGKRLFVTNDISSGGLLYVNGAGASTIAGDLIVNGLLTAKYNVNDISSSVIKGLDASLSKIPNVFEDISFNKRLFVNSDISSGGLLHINGLGTSVFLDNVDICGNLTVNYADDSIPVRAIPGLTSAITKSTTAPNITEDVSLNKRLFVNSDISSGGLLYVNGAGTSTIEGGLTVNGVLTAKYNVNDISSSVIKGLDASLNKIPNVLEDISLNKRLFVTSDISSGGLLYINGTGDSKITSGLTVGTLNADNITVSGNLTVNGTTTSLNTTNLGVKDSLIELSSGLTTGTSPINDSGILINRGNQNNVFMGWNEADKKFRLGETTATGTSTGGLNITVGTLVAKLNSDLVDINGGTIDNTPIGSSVASSGKFTSIESSSDVSMNSKLSVGGAVTLNQRVDICGNLYAQYPPNSIPQQAIIGGVGSNSFTGDVLVDYKLTVTNDVSMNSKLSVGGDVSMNSKLSVGDNVSMNSKLSVVGNVSMNSKLSVGDDVSFNSKLYVLGETRLDGLTICTRDISVNGLSVGRGSGNISSNTAFGSGALQNNSSGDNNTAIGYSASLNNSTGANNISIGSQASQASVGGSDNIAIGVQSLYINNGSKNIGIGTYAGSNLNSGTQNVMLGYYADVGSGTYNKSTAIGAYALITASNQITLGTASETVYVPGSTLLSGDVSMNNKLSIGGDVSMNSGLSIGGDVSMNQKLSLGGDVSMNSKLSVAGPVTLKQQVDICGNLYAQYPPNSIPQQAIIGGVGSNSFTGDVLVDYKLAVTKDVSMNSNLTVGGDVSMNSKLTVMGDVSMNSNLTVNGITVGRGAGNKEFNTAVGNSALSANTTGSYNTAFGRSTLQATTTTSGNSAFGMNVLYDLNGGSGQNSAFGVYALQGTTTGAYNTAIGGNAGSNNKTGSYNLFLGYDTDISGITATWSNSTAVGAKTKITASNQITLGTATETVYVPGTLSVIGDVSMNSKLSVGSDVSMNSKLSVAGPVTLKQQVDICGNLYAQYPSNSIPRDAIIGGVGSNNFTDDVSMNSKLSVGGDVSMNSKLLVLGDVSMNQKLSVGGEAKLNNLVVTNGITTNGTNSFGPSNFTNGASIDGSVYVTNGTINTGQLVATNAGIGNLTIDPGKTVLLVGDAKLVVGGSIEVNGDIIGGPSVTMFGTSSTINLGGASTNINIGTGTGTSSKVTIGGDVSMNQKLSVGGEAKLNNLVVTNGITTNGTNNFGQSNFSNTTVFSGVTTFQQTANFNEMVSNNAFFMGNVEMTTGKTMTLIGNSNLVVGGNAQINGSLTSGSTSVTMFETSSTINLGGSSTNINIGTGTGTSTTVTIGANNDTVNILGNLNITGTTTTISATNLDISDNAITLNKGGPSATFIGAGINIQENTDLSAGYIRVGADSARFAVRLPNLAGGVEQYMVTKDNNNNLTATIGNIVMASGKYIKQF